MTIQITFQYAAERKVVRIIGENILFIDLQTNMMSPFEGLKFNPEGIKKEYPDLKDINDDKKLQEIATERIVEKIKSFKTETERANWLIEELKMMGGTPLYQQRLGHRPQRIK